MASLAVPSFYSAKILAQPHTAATCTEVTPWRGILAVEPNPAVLNAKSVLLTNANYCVTRATSDSDLFSLQGTKAFPLAILSDRLGKRLLGAVARIVRRQWPRTRILILGRAAPDLEDHLDHLYDEQINRSSDPQQVLADLEGLYDGMWNQHSKTLDWNVPTSARVLVGHRNPKAIQQRLLKVHRLTRRTSAIDPRAFGCQPSHAIDQ